MEITYNEMIPDVSTYFELRQSVGWEIFSVEQAKKALCGSAFFVLAKDGERPVAMGRAVGDGMYYIIADVVVRPECQGNGIGKTIVSRLMKLIRDNSPEGARVSIQVDCGEGQRGILREAGFSDATA
jgi:GNAT superfamily N-acetyltransferase